LVVAFEVVVVVLVLVVVVLVVDVVVVVVVVVVTGSNSADLYPTVTLMPSITIVPASPITVSMLATAPAAAVKLSTNEPMSIEGRRNTSATVSCVGKWTTAWKSGDGGMLVVVVLVEVVLSLPFSTLALRVSLPLPTTASRRELPIVAFSVRFSGASRQAGMIILVAT
jgi:hypothetical protein